MIGMTYFEIFAEQLRWNMHGMTVLIAWAVLNIVVGIGYIIMTRTKKNQWYYAGLMCAAWNVVSLGLGLLGMWQIGLIDPAALDLDQVIYRSFSFERVLLLNAGLDVAYIVGGFLLVSMAQQHKKAKDLLTGFGKALWLQGGFLLLLDLVLIVINYTYTKEYGFYVLF
jgi:hypothetical protein